MHTVISNEISTPFGSQNTNAEQTIKNQQAVEGTLWGMGALSNTESDEWLQELATRENCGCGC